MSAKERERLKIFERVKRGELTRKDTAVLCALDYSCLRRLYKRYCAFGDRGLMHLGRRRPSNRAHQAEFLAAALSGGAMQILVPPWAVERLALDAYVLETLRGWF